MNGLLNSVYIYFTFSLLYRKLRSYRQRALDSSHLHAWSSMFWNVQQSKDGEKKACDSVCILQWEAV